MKNNDADVAELVDARDLKSRAATEGAGDFCKTSDIDPAGVEPVPARLQNQSWVYFIGAGDAIKIGFTTRLTKRITQIQNGRHETLILLAKTKGGRELERMYHRKFARHRIRGEWFQANRLIRYEIDRINGVVRIGAGSVQRGLSESARAQVSKIRALKAPHKDVVVRDAFEIMVQQVMNRDRETDNAVRASLNRAIMRQQTVIKAAIARAG